MSVPITEESLQAMLDQRFGGVLRAGSHAADAGEVCAIELRAVSLGLDWTDDNARTRDFDYRSLNDSLVSDALRTEWMLPIMVAYAGSLDWPQARQQGVVERLVILTVQRIIAELPGLPDNIRQQCRRGETMTAARAAAEAAEAAEAARGGRAAVRAAEAARAAVRAAEAAREGWAAEAARGAAAAARAARAAARAAVFVEACQIWLEAVEA